MFIAINVKIARIFVIDGRRGPWALVSLPSGRSTSEVSVFKSFRGIVQNDPVSPREKLVANMRETGGSEI
ncbi:hypothetical protein [Mycobacterium uberis]|uniref:hypothetical protein n=1 Tax=Mycobacterium uberis TaxID=2162698 RepID=UPI0014026989|nr:hypothetical protein [Mycobacterium uberis]